MCVPSSGLRAAFRKGDGERGNNAARRLLLGLYLQLRHDFSSDVRHARLRSPSNTLQQKGKKCSNLEVEPTASVFDAFVVAGVPINEDNAGVRQVRCGGERVVACADKLGALTCYEGRR